MDGRAPCGDRPEPGTPLRAHEPSGKNSSGRVKEGTLLSRLSLSLTCSVAACLKRAATLRPRFMLLALSAAIPCGCGDHCRTPIGAKKALEIARNFFLERSIEKLAAGKPYERREAEKIRSLGMGDGAYRRLFLQAEDHLSQIKSCHPRPLVQVSQSLAHGGYDVFFTDVISRAGSPNIIHAFTIGINITSCGEFGGFLSVSDRIESRQVHQECQ